MLVSIVSIGKPTLYEQLQADEEQALLERARASRNAIAQAHEHEAATLVDEAEIHRKLIQYVNQRAGGRIAHVHLSEDDRGM